MTEFIFMLTHDDMTVQHALEAYDAVRSTGLRYVGFKDVGVPVEVLRELTTRIRADGRIPVLEVVSISAEDEIRSIRSGLEIGVDILMGGVHVAAALPELAGSGIRYFPFPGTVVGHPSVLTGSVAGIAEHAHRLSETPGVDGLDLLAYRFDGDVPSLIGEVVSASRVPVVVAGSIDSDERIRVVRDASAWGFTIGGAVFDRAFVRDGTLADQIEHTLRVASSIPEGSRST